MLAAAKLPFKWVAVMGMRQQSPDYSLTVELTNWSMLAFDTRNLAEDWLVLCSGLPVAILGNQNKIQSPESTLDMNLVYLIHWWLLVVDSFFDYRLGLLFVPNSPPPFLPSWGSLCAWLDTELSWDSSGYLGLMEVIFSPCYFGIPAVCVDGDKITLSIET